MTGRLPSVEGVTQGTGLLKAAPISQMLQFKLLKMLQFKLLKITVPQAAPKIRVHLVTEGKHKKEVIGRKRAIPRMRQETKRKGINFLKLEFATGKFPVSAASDSPLICLI